MEEKPKGRKDILEGKFKDIPQGKEKTSNKTLGNVKKIDFKTIFFLIIIFTLLGALAYFYFGGSLFGDSIIRRNCDFLTIDGVGTVVRCTDGTYWDASKREVQGNSGEVSPPIAKEWLIDPPNETISLNISPPELIPTEIPQIVEELPLPSEQGIFGLIETIKYSYYWPPKGGPNCSNFQNGVCISHMASGKPWEDYVDLAAACPPEWAFGTIVIMDGNSYTCLDRGGAIKYDGNGNTYIDFLTATPTHSFGEYVDVEVIFPNN
jgi:hypothetical protein